MSFSERIIDFLMSFGLSPGKTILILSTFPVTELRAAIPIGMLVLEQNVKTVLFYSILGNILPIAPIYFFFEPVSRRLSRTAFMRRFFDWLFAHARKKGRLIEKYEAIGLMLFVGIPFPGTGVWTGCLVASLLRMRFVPTLIAACAGVVIAAVVVTILTLTGETYLRGYM